MNRFAGSVLTALLGLSSIAYLSVSFLEAAADKKSEALSRSLGRALAINGYRIDVPALAKPVEALQGAASLPGPSLLFVMSDSCPLCSKEVPVWEKFLRTSSFPPGVTVNLVTVNGRRFSTSMASAASAVGLAVSTWQVGPEALPAFAAASGLGSVPAAVVLDSEKRVRFVATRLGSSGATMIAELLEQLALGNVMEMKK